MPLEPDASRPEGVLAADPKLLHKLGGIIKTLDITLKNMG